MARNKAKILFVCTGNIFRSVAAEYCLRDYLEKEGVNNVIIKSAGTMRFKQVNHPLVLKALSSLGINARRHKQVKLNKKMLYEQDLVVAMAKDHQDFIKKEFGLDTSLFNELALKKSVSVLDVCEAVPDYKTNSEAFEKYVDNTVRYIHEVIPKLKEELVNRKIILF